MLNFDLLKSLQIKKDLILTASPFRSSHITNLLEYFRQEFKRIITTYKSSKKKNLLIFRCWSFLAATNHTKLRGWGSKLSHLSHLSNNLPLIALGERGWEWSKLSLIFPQMITPNRGGGLQDNPVSSEIIYL